MGWLKYITLLPFLYELIKGAVALVEATKAGLPGAEKKAAVLGAITSNWDSAQAAFGISVDVTKIIPVLSFLIDLIVAVYNAIGYFAKKDVPVIVDPAPIPQASKK